jgi:hypothetical protein
MIDLEVYLVLRGGVVSGEVLFGSNQKEISKKTHNENESNDHTIFNRKFQV